MKIAVDKAQKDGKCTVNNVENHYSVYAHVFPNGKLYIGATRQKPIYRWRRGCGYRNTKNMNKAIKEFGWDSIKHVVLMENIDKETAMEIEKELIKKYDTQNPEHGYNTKNGGQSFGEHSEEFLESLKNRMIGNTYSAGRKMSEEHKRALIESQKNRKPTRSFLGHKHSESSKELMSKLAKERWKDPEYRAKEMASRPDFSGDKNPRYGKPVSEETRRKISLANKGKCPTKEHLEKLWSANSKGVYCIDSDGKIVAEYKSIKEAAESVGACSANIGFCCKNPNRTCRKYYWRFKEIFDVDRC